MGKKMSDVLLDIDSKPYSVGQMIKAFRKARGFTLKDVEELTSISITHLSSIENDKIDLGIRRAGLLAAALGVHPSDILFPNGNWDKTAEIRKIEKLAQKFA